MTRRIPSSNLAQGDRSDLPVRQPPSSSPSVALKVFTAPQSKSMSSRFPAFAVADMDGRGPRQNRACASCITKLTADELAQINWHIPEGESCKLCDVMSVKPEVFAKPFCDFIDENPTVFHAVDYFKQKLAYLKFEELRTSEDWTDRIKAGGRYFVTRNGSTLIAFTVGKAYKPGNGAGMVAGHIDALTAKLKPVSSKPNKAGYVQLGVAPYAGGLNETWWDRDLSIGGRVVVKDEKTGKTSTKLVKLDWPIAKIPTLAPHFGKGIMGNNNKETEAVPVVGLESSADQTSEKLGPEGSFVNSQPPKLVKLIAKELGIGNPGSIVGWGLELFDSQGSQFVGMDKELISAPRIDDKLCSWSALMALLASTDGEDEGYIKLVALFDDEEIGSLLRQGAKGNFLPSVIERTVEALSPSSFGPGLIGQTYAKSFLLSADVTHAGNPNFLGSYLDDHIPKLNTGITIAADSNGHMTTDAVSTAIVTRAAELSGSKTQNFMIRNDSRSGGTIGPSLSSLMGVRAADVGLPQLSMHSIRATTGSLDPGLGVKFFKGFLDNWEKIDAEWASDE